MRDMSVRLQVHREFDLDQDYTNTSGQTQRRTQSQCVAQGSRTRKEGRRIGPGEALACHRIDRPYYRSILPTTRSLALPPALTRSPSLSVPPPPPRRGLQLPLRRLRPPTPRGRSSSESRYGDGGSAARYGDSCPCASPCDPGDSRPSRNCGGNDNSLTSGESVSRRIYPPDPPADNALGRAVGGMDDCAWRASGLEPPLPVLG